jgi:16S rRNA (guanine527-N7)-methyltransferase
MLFNLFIGITNLNLSTKFEYFTKLLLNWNNIHNLTGLKTTQDIQKNIDDSLIPFEHISNYKTILDIGSGCGFPAIPIAISQPKIEITLTEPRNKRASFLHIVKSELELNNINILTSRVEDVQGNFDLITSRAVRDTLALIEMSKHISTDKTSYLFYKGSCVDKELEKLQNYKIIKNDKINYIYIEGKK